MAYSVTSFEATPNPNAVKCVLDRPPTERPRSYFTAEQAAGDPLASALFAIPGVTNVLVHMAFVTVCKRPDAEWKGIKASIRKVLRDSE